MYESAAEPMLPPTAFAARILRHLAISQLLVAFSLLVGMAGYHWTEGFGWLDSFLESAMLLGGMGPVHPLTTDAGKLFAGIYALYAGLVFIAVGGFILAPLLHRVLHRLKVD